MKKRYRVFILMGLGVLLSGCAQGVEYTQPEPQNISDPQLDQEVQGNQEERQVVIDLVESFGDRLKKTSLLAPGDEVSRSIEEHYAEFLSAELLKNWKNNPDEAVGRTLSSPWPDRIEILKVEKADDDSYQVEGEVIEMTSVEELNGGIAGKYPVLLTVKKIDGEWFINQVVPGEYQAENLVYENLEFGFRFQLTESWEGYLTLQETWQGEPLEKSAEEAEPFTGPQIVLRHPQWTEQEPYQDIPIMVFTLSQWEALENDEYHIGAAPIGPKELGRNEAYVFALPARYNFHFPTGFEEVEALVNSGALQPIQ